MWFTNTSCTSKALGLFDFFVCLSGFLANIHDFSSCCHYFYFLLSNLSKILQVAFLLTVSILPNHRLHSLTLYLREKPFNTFANRADPDQAAHKSCLIKVYSVCLWKYNPTLGDLTSNFFVLYTNVKVHLYNYL